MTTPPCGDGTGITTPTGSITKPIDGFFAVGGENRLFTAPGDQATLVVIDKADQLAIAGHVGLIAGGVPVGPFLGPDLDAGIGVAAELEIGRQLEVGRLPTSPLAPRSVAGMRFYCGIK